MRTAKPCTLFSTMTHNPGDHVRYLFDGHGMAGNEPQLWTKGIRKEAKNIDDIAAYWDQIYEDWKANVAENATMTGKQVFVALPNDIQPEEIEKVAKAILKTVPQHHPSTITVHYTSGKNNIRNIHLHGVISMRRGGYGKTNDTYRLNSRQLAKDAVDKTLRECGYTIVKNEKKYQVRARPTPPAVRWLKAQGWTREQLRDTTFLRRAVLPKVTSERMREWLSQEIRKAENVKFSDAAFRDGLHIGSALRQRLVVLRTPSPILAPATEKVLPVREFHNTLPRKKLETISATTGLREMFATPKKQAEASSTTNSGKATVNLRETLSKALHVQEVGKLGRVGESACQTDGVAADNSGKFGSVSAEAAGARVVNGGQILEMNTTHRGQSAAENASGRQISKQVKR